MAPIQIILKLVHLALKTVHIVLKMSQFAKFALQELSWIPIIHAFSVEML